MDLNNFTIKLKDCPAKKKLKKVYSQSQDSEIEKLLQEDIKKKGKILSSKHDLFYSPEAIKRINELNKNNNKAVSFLIDVNKEIALVFVESEQKNEYFLDSVFFNKPRRVDWEKYCAQHQEINTPLYMTAHSCQRYQQRYHPGVDIKNIYQLLKELIEHGNGEISGVAPEWVFASDAHGADMFLIVLDGEMVLPLVKSIRYKDYLITTVISRSSRAQTNSKISKSKSKSKNKKNKKRKKSQTFHKNEIHKNNRLKANKKKRKAQARYRD